MTPDRSPRCSCDHAGPWSPPIRDPIPHAGCVETIDVGRGIAGSQLAGFDAAALHDASSLRHGGNSLSRRTSKAAPSKPRWVRDCHRARGRQGSTMVLRGLDRLCARRPAHGAVGTKEAPGRVEPRKGQVPAGARCRRGDAGCRSDGDNASVRGVEGFGADLVRRNAAGAVSGLRCSGTPASGIGEGGFGR